ncbi:MAG: hypothetical protein HDT25_05030 [Ruminococcus sp.]|nr:hypothetical protein [Ruminococcus sp.]
MRKKIVLGIVILAAIVGAVYFNKNYAIVEDKYGTKLIVSIDVTEISDENHDEFSETVKCTPSLRKLTKLEKLWLTADEDMDLKYLSEMKNMNELTIFYHDGYCGRLETLPDLPNVKQLELLGSSNESWNTFALDESEYYLSNIDTLVLQLFDIVDFESLKHFENLHTLKILHVRDDAKEDLIKQSEELQEKGIDVEIW